MELLVFDRRELQKEGEKLRTLLELRGKQWEEERGRLEDQVLYLHLHLHPHLHQVGRVGRMLEEATTELQGSSTDLRLAQGKVCRLEARLRDQGQEVASLTSRLSSASSTSTSLSAAALAATRLEGHQTRLARCSSSSSSSSSSPTFSSTSCLTAAALAASGIVWPTAQAAAPASVAGRIVARRGAALCRHFHPLLCRRRRRAGGGRPRPGLGPPECQTPD